jgi:hypothetical protein
MNFFTPWWLNAVTAVESNEVLDIPRSPPPLFPPTPMPHHHLHEDEKGFSSFPPKGPEHSLDP